MQPHRVTLLSAALAAVCPLLGVQASHAAEPVVQLEEVVVRQSLVEPLPQAAGQINQELLNARRASVSDTARLLQGVPGVSVYGAGGVSSLPVIRGLADDRLRIKVDGMDLISACGNHMNAPLSYADPSNVHSVQVFSGITPVSVGGDSIGGSVLVNSPDPAFAQPGEGWLRKGEAGAFYRGNGHVVGGNLSATVANESLSLSYRGSTVDADNYRAGADFKPAGLAAAGRAWLDGDAVGSSAYKSTNQSLAMGWRQDNHLLELKLGVQDIPFQGYPNQRMDMTGNDSEQINLRYKGSYAWGLLDARVYHEHTRHKMNFGHDKLYWYGPTLALDGVPCTTIRGGSTGCAAGMPMDTEGKNTGLSVKADVSLNERDLLRMGGELQRYRLDDWWDPSGKGMWPNTFWNIRDGERDRAALFGEWEARWSPTWLTLVGLRHETVKMNTGPVQGYNDTFSGVYDDAFNAADRRHADQNLDLVALARFKPSDTQTYEFGYGMKTRSPNLYERYAWSVHGMAMRMVNLVGDGNGYVGNLQLQPETAHTLSATADWHDATGKRWGFKATPYVTHVDNYIDGVRCSIENVHGCTAANLVRTDGFVYLRYANQSARLYGLDLSGHRVIGDSPAGGKLSARGTLSVLRGTNRTTGDQLYNMMPLNARLALDHQAGRWTTTLEAELVAAKDRVNSERNEMQTAGYGLVHLRASYALKQVRFDVGIENLFDRFYNHPLGGAYVGQGKTMSGTDRPWGTPVPGAGRTLYAGVNVQF